MANNRRKKRKAKPQPVQHFPGPHAGRVVADPKPVHRTERVPESVIMNLPPEYWQVEFKEVDSRREWKPFPW